MKIDEVILGWLALEDEIKTLDAMLENLTTQYTPRLRGRFGVGPQTAAVLVAVAGDNPERLKSEASLAALCGVSPLQASSGKSSLGSTPLLQTLTATLVLLAKRIHGLVLMSIVGQKKALRKRKFIDA